MLLAASVNLMDSANYDLVHRGLLFQIVRSNPPTVNCSGFELVSSPFGPIYLAQHQAFASTCLLRWEFSLPFPFAVSIVRRC